MTIGMGFAPLARPTARAPFVKPSSVAMAPYDVVTPYGMERSLLHTSCSKGEPGGCSGRSKLERLRAKYSLSCCRAARIVRAAADVDRCDWGAAGLRFGSKISTSTPSRSTASWSVPTGVSNRERKGVSTALRVCGYGFVVHTMLEISHVPADPWNG